MLKQICYALLYPCLSYGIIVWVCAYKTRLNCLQTKQNKSLRRIFFAHSKESADPYFKLLGLLKVGNIYKFKMCCLIHKIMNKADSIPDIISDILTLASRIHRYNTRFAGKFNLFRVQISTNSGKSSFNFAGSFLFFKKEWKCRLLINQS